MKKLVIALVALTAGYTSMNAQGKGEKQIDVVTSDKTGWHKIGEMTASFKQERDVMIVAGADKFAAIKIKAVDADINIVELEVYYENGTQENIPVRSEIKKGTESRVIDLKGGERNLKKISFVYKTMAGSPEKAQLIVWGLKTNAKK